MVDAPAETVSMDLTKDDSDVEMTGASVDFDGLVEEANSFHILGLPLKLIQLLLLIQLDPNICWEAICCVAICKSLDHGCSVAHCNMCRPYLTTSTAWSTWLEFVRFLEPLGVLVSLARDTIFYLMRSIVNKVVGIGTNTF